MLGKLQTDPDTFTRCNEFVSQNCEKIFTFGVFLSLGLILAHDRKRSLGYRCSTTDCMSVTLWINYFDLLHLIYLHVVNVSPHSHTAPHRKLWNHTKNTAISSTESQRDLRQSSPLRSATSLPRWRWQLLIRVWMQAGGGMVVTHRVMPGPHSQTKWTLAKGNLCMCLCRQRARGIYLHGCIHSQEEQTINFSVLTSGRIGKLVSWAHSRWSWLWRIRRGRECRVTTIWVDIYQVCSGCDGWNKVQDGRMSQEAR